MSSRGSAPTSRHVLRALCPVRYFSQCRSRALDHLPSIAPKPSINIKHIRQNPESYSRNCVERNYKAQSDHPFKIVKLFDQWHQSQIETRSLREKSNAIQSQLSRVTKSSGPKQSRPRRSRQDLIEEARKQKNELSTTEIHEAQLTSEIETLAAELPNLTSVDTPRQEPRVVGYINEGLKPDGTSLKDPYHRKIFSRSCPHRSRIGLVRFLWCGNNEWVGMVLSQERGSVARASTDSIRPVSCDEAWLYSGHASFDGILSYSLCMWIPSS